MPELEEIPPELLKLSEKTFQDLFEAAKIAKLSKEELMWYDIEMKRKRDAYAVMECAVQEGVDKGIGIGMEKGMEKGREDVLALVEEGYSPAEIRNMLAIAK